MQVMSLRGQFAASVQQAQAAQAASPEEAHTADDDDETAKGMARLFAEVGESIPTSLPQVRAVPDLFSVVQLFA